MTRQATARPTVYVIEAKWNGSSHRWVPYEYIADDGMAAFNQEDRALARLAHLREHEPMFCGMPVIYRLTSYVRNSVLPE